MKVSIRAVNPVLPERKVEQGRTLTDTVKAYLGELKQAGVEWPKEVLVLWPRATEPWRTIKKTVRIDANGPITKRW